MVQWVYVLLFLVIVRVCGFFAGRTARWFGFSSVETFFAYRGSYTKTSCMALIVAGAICFVAASIFPTPAGVTLLTAVAGLAFIWGALCGIDPSDFQAIDGSNTTDNDKLD